MSKVSTRFHIDHDLLDCAKEETDRRHGAIAQVIHTAMVEMRQK